MPTRVLILDQSDVVRIGLAEILQSTDCIKVVGETHLLEEALDIAGQCEPDVAIFDLASRDCHLNEVVTQLRERSPRTRLLLFTSLDCPDAANKCFVAGADGYILKAASKEEVLAAVQTVGAGRKIVSQGKTNQQIADEMFLSVKTIETYRSRASKKVGASSRAELFEFARSLGVLTPAEN